jgi:hypothetical protein
MVCLQISNSNPGFKTGTTQAAVRALTDFHTRLENRAFGEWYFAALSYTSERNVTFFSRVTSRPRHKS